MEASMYIEHSWHQLEAGLRAKGAKDIDLHNARLVFEGGLGVALVAIVKHGASVVDIEQAMKWIDPEVAG